MTKNELAVLEMIKSREDFIPVGDSVFGDVVDQECNGGEDFDCELPAAGTVFMVFDPADDLPQYLKLPGYCEKCLVEMYGQVLLREVTRGAQ
jgi:hypothetical protein